MINKETLRILSQIEKTLTKKLPKKDAEELMRSYMVLYRLGFTEGLVAATDVVDGVVNGMHYSCAMVYNIVGDLDNGDMNPIVEQSISTLDEFENRFLEAMNKVPLMKEELH